MDRYRRFAMVVGIADALLVGALLARISVSVFAIPVIAVVVAWRGKSFTQACERSLLWIPRAPVEGFLVLFSLTAAGLFLQAIAQGLAHRTPIGLDDVVMFLYAVLVYGGIFGKAGAIAGCAIGLLDAGAVLLMRRITRTRALA